MIVLIDNYDSFTYNLFQLLATLGVDVSVIRNDAATAVDVRAMEPEGIVISPGPGMPSDAGISCEIIRELGASVPILGVCLGHQCMASVFGGRVVRAETLMHGKTSSVTHENHGVFYGLPTPLRVVRYHSLVVDERSLPTSFEITARTVDGVVMGIRHRTLPLEGVQFHPESILTESGPELLQNWLDSLVPKAGEAARHNAQANDSRLA